MSVSSDETVPPLNLNSKCVRRPSATHEADSTNLSDEMFVSLVKGREALLYRMAFMYVRNEHDALAMVSETVCKAYSSKHKLRDPALFHTWMTRILINVCLNHIKRKKRVLLATEDFLDEQADNHARLEHKERQVLLSEAISRMRPEYKTVVLLRYYQQLSVKDTAAVMRRRENTVKTLTRRALMELKDMIGEDSRYE
jgi:RNA polymerase sigma-70 factor (ECF subfamily)